MEPSHRETITLEHADSWKYGGNYLFIDFKNRDDIGLDVYGEWFPRLSINKILDKKPAIAWIKDIAIVGGLNIGSEPSDDPFRAYLLGAGLQFNIPYTELIQLDFMAYKADGVNSTGIQITPVWSIPVTLGQLKFKLRGFLDYVSSRATGRDYFLLAQPQILLDLSSVIGTQDKVYVGIEYWYWRHKFGINGVNEQSLQAMVLVNL